MAAQGFVDRVIDDLIDEMMQSHLAGRADVHRRTQPNRGQSLENGNILSRVASTLLFPGGSALDWASFKL